jgi:SAM-dependent methyltransferase
MSSCHSELSYSLRRYFVDEFHFRHVPTLPSGSLVLDLGGNKIRKRGQFDIERYDLRVVYANLSTAKRPDVETDAAHVPFEDGCFDAVICSELLEHMPDPPSVLREAYRVLKPAGCILISVPFLVQVHADPLDYGRYTAYYWETNMKQVGFRNIQSEQQGFFFSVLVEMLRGWIQHIGVKKCPLLLRRLLSCSIAWARRKALEWEADPNVKTNTFYRRYATGYGIRARK